MNEKDLIANSYCVLYENSEFVIGLANKEKEKVDVKAMITFSDKEFRKYFNTVCSAIMQFEKETGKSFIEEIKDEEE